MKFIKLILITSMFLMNSSCLTKELWKKKERYYGDIINQYLIAKDGKKIIFLGTKYHYIFDDNNSSIKDLLNWSGRKKLVMSISNFNLIAEDKVEVSVKVSNDSGKLDALSKSELLFLKNLGFEESMFREDILEKTFYLVGKRYLPKPNVSYDFKSSLNREYYVSISIKYDSAKDISSNLAWTPITIVGDTVIIAGSIAIAAFVIPASVISCFDSKPSGFCSEHH